MADTTTETSSVDFGKALREALITAALTLGLAVPIVLLRTEQDMNNTLILQWRWGLVAALVGIAFAARLGWELVGPHLRGGGSSGKAQRHAAMPRSAQTALAIFGVALLVAYPIFVLWRLGPSGSIKWIDNFGIQILIYVMLGWGLNIVVGLA
ncbi:MAG TPA: DUF3382 domain-containing protein, partial [Hyphomicrobiaceae bacterium]|nr:DUF3382 domain-containing protein [Hyphomicrobiaceae bacterium]